VVWRSMLHKVRSVGLGTVAMRGFVVLAIRARAAVTGSKSQYGEDLVLYRLLGRKHEGFYVDVGAYHPLRLSNTCFFYEKGWHGVNVEPTPLNHGRFLAMRERDVNLNVGVSDHGGQMTFHEFEAATRSTFSEEEAKRSMDQGYRRLDERTVPVTTLTTIFAKYAADREVDFLSIDTEGMEMSVLNGNDWSHYRPHLVCIEAYENDESSVVGMKNERPDVAAKLATEGYHKVYDNGTNCIYRDTTWELSTTKNLPASR